MSTKTQNNLEARRTPVAGAVSAAPDDRTAISSDLADRSPEIHWPDGYDPADADLFAHNDITINRPVKTVWRNLINASAWPKWYSNASDVVVNGPSQLLDAGVSFEWVTFGLPVTSTVAEFLPPTRIGWYGTSTGLHAYHTWLLAPVGEGAYVVMEEVGNGPAAQQLARNNPGQMHRGHDLWNVSLKFLCET
jgi:Polyketide cyclase / dehydrase and lipid transport